MDKTTVFCPNCDATIKLNEGDTIGALPPTGGDYEWQESDKEYTCIYCKEPFKTRVRTSIENGLLLLVNSFSKPKKEHIVWYAVGFTSKSYFNVNCLNIMVDAIFKTQQEAQENVDFYQKKQTYINKEIIKITNKGCFTKDNNLIKEEKYADSIFFNHY